MNVNLKDIFIKNQKILVKLLLNKVVRIKIEVESEIETKKQKITRKDYIECVAFDLIAADILDNYIEGDLIYITAMVQNRSYTNKDNQKIYTNDFIIKEINKSADRS